MQAAVKVGSAVVLAAVGVLAVARGVRSRDPMRHVAGVTYSMRCGACGQVEAMTTARLQAMVGRGEVESPPNEMRRFKCPRCGRVEMVPEEGLRRANP